MEKVEIVGAPETVTPKYKLEVTKNTKGYNYVVAVRSDSIEELKEDVTTLTDWANENYSSKT